MMVATPTALELKGVICPGMADPLFINGAPPSNDADILGALVAEAASLPFNEFCGADTLRDALLPCTALSIVALCGAGMPHTFLEM